MVAVDGLDELAKSTMGTVEATKLEEYDDTLATFVAKCQPTAGDDPTFLNTVSKEFDYNQPFDLKANIMLGIPPSTFRPLCMTYMPSCALSSVSRMNWTETMMKILKVIN